MKRDNQHRAQAGRDVLRSVIVAGATYVAGVMLLRLIPFEYLWRRRHGP